MHAAIATFLGLPALIRRLWKTVIAGLWRIAAGVAMYSTARKAEAAALALRAEPNAELCRAIAKLRNALA